MMVAGSVCRQVSGFLLGWLGGFCRAVSEAEAVVAGLHDVAVVGEAVEQRRRHLGIAEDRGPFAEAEVGGDDDAGALVELAEQVEQQRAAGRAEGQISELIENDEDRCRVLAKKLSRTVIINDNGSDPSVLRNENVAMADVLICATETEEDNLLASLIGKHLGVSKVISTYSKREYEEIFGMSGIDASVGYYHVVANEIIKETVHNYEVMLLLEKFSEE